jgi:aconitate hydratase
MSTTDTSYRGQLAYNGQHYCIIDLERHFHDSLHELPVVLRLLLENVCRNLDGPEREDAVKALLAWRKEGHSTEEIAFQPSRVLMHDTTSTPALVDIAAMRDTLAEAGVNPGLLNPQLPVQISVDHSLAVEAYAHGDSAQANIAQEIRRNAERYRFLRWASRAVKGVHVNPPGTGIMHTINMEQLATVVTTAEHQGCLWAMPDMMIGTDSHTPMINGLGVLGWGVGGLEAQTVMFGMPVMQRIPDVIGVYLEGRLPVGVLATDLALYVTQQLRQIGVSGEFVEFFGPGVSSLGASERCVIANMAPEYGATTGYFAVDQATLDYLSQTGRPQAQINLIRHYMQSTGLWFDPDDKPRYSRTLQINLSELKTSVAGPRRPQDRMDHTQVPASLRALNLPAVYPPEDMPAFPVVIAAIASCTNTSDPGLLMAAGILARKARQRGLRPAPWVKTSLSPGSPAAASYLSRSGLLNDLAHTGFDIVGYGCATCIGNSGPLPEVTAQLAAQGRIHPVAVVSGNRNFPGRIHPDLDLGLLMAPPLVVAYALTGNAMIDFTHEPLGLDTHGEPVYLSDIWPTQLEIQESLKQGVNTADFAREFKQAGQNPLWHSLDAPDSALFGWDSASTTLRRPPFASLDYGTLLGTYDAHPLLVLGDDITTDHISPASAIPPNSFIADFLVERGEDRNDLNVFASRRGNWEVMLQGAYFSKSLVNRLDPGAPTGYTLHVPSGKTLPLWQAAQRYQEDGNSVIIVAGHRYGTGSSRDWAAKVQRLLGVRAVLAQSFERIHRSNLVGMGILPLRLPESVSPDTLAIKPGDCVHIHADPSLTAYSPIPVTIKRACGTTESFVAIADIQTQLEVKLLRQGGVIPMILKRFTS